MKGTALRPLPRHASRARVNVSVAADRERPASLLPRTEQGIEEATARPGPHLARGASDRSPTTLPRRGLVDDVDPPLLLDSARVRVSRVARDVLSSLPTIFPPSATVASIIRGSRRDARRAGGRGR